MAEVYDGVIYGDYSKYTRLRINYTVSQNETTAVSTITMNLYAERTKGSEQYNNSGQAYWNLTGKGNTSMKFSWAASSLEMHLGSSSTTVQHNPDGTGSVTLSGYWYTGRTGSSYIPESISISKNITLKTIPRASSVSGGSGNIGGTTTISVLRASTSFTHTLKYAFGSLNGTIATGVGTSYTWTIPTSFYAQIPNAKSGTGTIYCETYSGSTLIGTKTTSFTATVTEASSRPTVSATLTDTNATTKALTGNASKMVKGKSTGQLVITSSVKNSATIKSVTVNGTNVGTAASITKTYANISTASFTIVTTDSRGFTNTSYVVTPSYVNYVPLTLSATIFRPQPTGTEIKMTYSGNYFNGNFGAKQNSMGMEWYYRVKGSSSWIKGGTITPTFSGNTIVGNTISLGNNYDYQTTYEFYIYAQDQLTSFSATIPVSVGMPIFYWGKEFLRVTKKLIVDGEIVKNDGYLPVYRGATTNFNEALTHGFYSFSGTNIEGSPVSSQVYGTLEVIVQNSQTWVASNYSLFIWQIYRDTTGKEFHRFGVNEETMSGWRRIYKETTLYNNTSGTGGTITLSETSANFSYIEIFFENSANGYESVKVYSPNGKIATLTSSYYDGTIYLFTKRITISGTSITNKDYGQVWMSNGGTANITAENKFSIVKVVGYR